MKRVRLTMAQALVRYLTAQKVEMSDGTIEPLFAGVFAIFGHGNVAALGEALYHQREALPTYRGHNEQSMAHAAIAYAKAQNRRRMMACTTSIGPGATNMVTAAALAHVNRLPVLLLPGDVFASRSPDPVLQQIERGEDPTVTANDCFKPVSRYFDRITRPEQLVNSLPTAVQVLTDAEHCGPVTLSIPQDVQAEAYDYPESFFAERIHRPRRQIADVNELAAAVEKLKAAKKPLILSGGGVLYSDACKELANFAAKHNVPVCETQAGKGALAWTNSNNVGAVGVTGSSAANEMAKAADVVLAIGSRMQDFTTASRSLFENPDATLIQLNVAKFDVSKHNAQGLLCDAKVGLAQLSDALGDWQAPANWMQSGIDNIVKWNAYYNEVTSVDKAPETPTGLPSDAQVLGALQRAGKPDDIVVGAAGGLPGELHKLWRTDQPNGYHLEYGFSCMGYEIAGGMGVKMAHPEREIIVMVGDGSYMMMNSELATSVMLGQKIIVVVLDNRGFACINRLQNATGGESFNNLLQHCEGVDEGAPVVDFAAHACALGAAAEQVDSMPALEEAMGRARASDKSYVISLMTDPYLATPGNTWWEVAVPEVSVRETVVAAHANYVESKKQQPN